MKSRLPLLLPVFALAAGCANVDPRDWIGRTEQAHDRITPVPARALAATLDREGAHWRDGDPLPPLWHWLYFLPLHPQRELAADGHARRGGFLPAVRLPRRMWAGGRLRLHEPLRIGDEVARDSRIDDVSAKAGRSGALVFVRVRHQIARCGAGAPRAALTEEHDIVYREAAQPGAVAAARCGAPADAQFERAVVPTSVLLFRYSALTFNGHRIHYDRGYCVEEEGYPGLLVHAPLQATLLAELLAQHAPDRTLASFAYRALHPLFDPTPFTLCGRIDGDRARLWVRDGDGRLTMDATAEFA